MRGSGIPLAAALLLLAGCGASDEPAPTPAETGATPAGATLAPAPLPPQVADFPALASRDCGEVVQFYLAALRAREWAQAALVWNDPVIDAARLEAVFGDYGDLQVAQAEPIVEGAAGSSYCTVSGRLTDARDPARPPRDGMLELRRVNDVPGATPDQLRWTLRASTFVEPLQRSDRGEP